MSARQSHRVYGSLEGGVGCGSGEARALSDDGFLKCVSWSCWAGISGKRENSLKSRLSSMK